MKKLEMIGRIADTIAIAAFFGVWFWVGWHNRSLQIEPLIASWKDAAPAKGAIDKVANRAADAIPDKGKLEDVASAAATTLGAASTGIRMTVANINRPCKGAAGPDACGVLAGAGKVLAKAGDAVVTTQTAELKAVPHMTRAMDAFADAAYSLDDAARSGQSSLDAFNDLMGSKDLADALHNVAGMTDSGNGILADGRKVSDKMTADYLKPVKWYMQPVKRVGELWDIGAAVARHAP